MSDALTNPPPHQCLVLRRYQEDILAAECQLNTPPTQAAVSNDIGLLKGAKIPLGRLLSTCDTE
jgi:hypothetical protein